MAMNFRALAITSLATATHTSIAKKKETQQSVYQGPGLGQSARREGLAR